MPSLIRSGKLSALAALCALFSARVLPADWAVVNAACSPLLDDPGVSAAAKEILYPGMRVRILDANAAPGYVRAVWADKTGYMRAQELLRGFIPEDKYPGPQDHPEPEFLESDRNGNGVPDFRDIVYAARDMLGLPFDDSASLRLDLTGQTPDGLHSDWAHDGKDNNGDGVIDDRDEDVIVCIDLLVRSLEQAGYPMSARLRAAAREHPELFAEGPGREPIRDEFLTRRVRNIVAFTRHCPDFKFFREPDIRSPTAFPRERARPGDLLFFGLARDYGKRKFTICHSAICVSVDPLTGLPGWMITAVVPRVQFYDLRRGYHRFVYCAHARLMPERPAQNAADTVEVRPVHPMRAEEPPGAAGVGPYALPTWALLAHPGIRVTGLPARSLGSPPTVLQPLSPPASPVLQGLPLPSWPFVIGTPVLP